MAAQTLETRTWGSTRRRRVTWAWSLQVVVWLVVATALWFFADSGALAAERGIDQLYAAGRATGIVAAVLVMVQVLLISRSPWIERAVGHDNAARWHTVLGKVAFVLILVHAALITSITASYQGVSVLEQSTAFRERGLHMLAAQVGVLLLTVVVVTSLAVVWKRWRYERWHAVHLLVYASIALVVPHQFLEGTTFIVNDTAWWFWAVLYTLAFGSFVIFRLVRPVVRLWRYRMRVDQVIPHADGSTTVVIAGRGLERLRARPGQFFLWRFLDRTRGRQAHPFSLSRAPDGSTLRITVQDSGDMTHDIAGLAVGTRVVAEGPLGIFTADDRTQPGVVWVAAGIGVTPVRAMLEEHGPDDGPADMVVRASSDTQAPLIEEIRALSADRDVNLHVLTGPRGEGWASADHPATLTDLVPDAAARDIYVCGPPAWSDAVEADARAAGCPARSIHRERFGWGT